MTKILSILFGAAMLSTAPLSALAQNGGICPCDDCVLAKGSYPGMVLPANDAAHKEAYQFTLNDAHSKAVAKAVAAGKGILCQPDCTASNLTYETTLVPAGNAFYTWEVRGDCRGKAAVLVKPVGLAPGTLKSVTAPPVEFKPGATAPAPTPTCPPGSHAVTVGGKTTCAR